METITPTTSYLEPSRGSRFKRRVYDDEEGSRGLFGYKPISKYKSDYGRLGLTQLYETQVELKSGSGSQLGVYTSMPNYPTKMGEDYFSSFSGKDLPQTSIYSDLWKARTGSLSTPKSLERMDREMSNAGLGYKFNYLTKSQLYKEDQGVIGSALVSAGRFADWALGFQNFKTSETERSGRNQGSIHKMFGMQSPGNSDGGPFEAIASQTYSVMAGTALSISAYIAVDLPLKYLKSQATSDFFNHSLKEVTGWGGKLSWRDQSIRLSRRLVYGSSTANVIDYIEAKQGYKDLLRNLDIEYAKDSISTVNPLRYSKEGGQPSRSGNKGWGIARKGSGISSLSAITLARKLDAQRFDKLIKPILEQMNPYSITHKNKYYSGYIQGIEKLEGTTASVPKEIETTDVSGRPVRIFEDLGADHLRKVAVAYDHVSSLLPANMLYWTKPTRELFNLPEFDPEKNITIRDLVSFENAVKWADNFYHKAKSVLFNPIQSLSKVNKVWKGELSLRKQEKLLIDSLQSSSVPGGLNISSGASAADMLASLSEAESKFYSSRSADIDKTISTKKFGEYKKAIETQSSLLLDDLFSTKSDLYYSPNPYKEDGSAAKGRIDKLKGSLLLVGTLLAIDSLADRYFFRPLGASLTTQVRAGDELETKDGDVAHFTYSGTLSRSQALAAQVTGGVIAGLAFPNFTDIGLKKGSLGSILTEADTYAKSIHEIQSSIKQQQVDLTQRRVTAEQLAEASKASYIASKSKLTSILKGRSKARFNTKSALLGAFLGSVIAKTAASGIARFLNWSKDRDGAKLELSGANAVIGARFENIAASTVRSAKSHEDYVDAAMAHWFSKQMLDDKDNDSTRVFTLASQVTTPFFQLPIVIKTDQRKRKASIGVGLQLMQTTGIGFTPLLPIALRLKKDPSEDTWDYENKRIADYIQNWRDAGPIKRSVIMASVARTKVTDFVSGSVVHGTKFTYDSDSVWGASTNFVAASSALLLASSYIKDADPIKVLSDRYGTDSKVVKELSYLANTSRPVRKGVEGVLGVANKSSRFLSSIPIHLGHSTVLGIQAIKNEMLSKSVRYQDLEAKPVGFSYSPVENIGRRAAPYLLAVAFTGMLLNPESGYDPDDLGQDRYRSEQAVWGVGLSVGFALDKAGVFASADDLAEDFRHVMRDRGLDTVEGYRKTIGNAFPSVDVDDVVSQEDLKKVTEGMLRNGRKSSPRSRRFHPSRYLLGEIASPSLWSQGYQAASQLPIDNLDTFSTTLSKTLKGGRIKSMGARVALASIVIGSLKLGANALANSLSDRSLESLYNTPFIGPTLKVLSGVTTQKDGLTGFGDKTRGIQKTLYSFANALTLGLFNIGKNTGLYSDNPDAFLNIAGPVGVTFKSNRTGTYAQHSTPFTDLSYTAYDLSFGSNADSIKYDIYSRIEKGTAGTFTSAWAQVRGGTARKSRSTHKGSTSSELKQLGKSSSLSRAASIRHFKMENLSWQTAQEQTMDHMRDAFKYGLLESTVLIEGVQKDFLYNPFNILKSAQLSMSTNSKPHAYSDQELENQLIAWIGSAEWQRNTVKQSYGLRKDIFNSQWDREVNSMPGAKMLGVLVGAAHIVSNLFMVETAIGGLSAKFYTDEIDTLAKSSPLNQVKAPLVNIRHYEFRSGVENGSTYTFQIDLTNRDTGLYRMPLSLEDLNGISGSSITAQEYSSFASSTYKRQHAALNDVFREEYSKAVNSLYKKSINSSDADYIKDVNAFKDKVMGKIDLTISRTYKATLGETPVSMFQVMTGASLENQDMALRQFMKEGDELLLSALDEVIAELEGIRASGFEGIDPKIGVMRLNSSLTNSQAFTQFYNRLERPIHGSFDAHSTSVGTDYKRNRRVLGESAVEELEQYARDYRRTLKQSSSYVNIPSSSVRNTTKTWSEGAISYSMRSLKSTSSATAMWAFDGVSIYEAAEAGTLLLGGDKESLAVRKAAGRQLVTTAIYHAIGLGISAALMATGLGALPSLAIGITGSLGIEGAKKRFTPVRKLEQCLINGLGGLLATPIDTLAKPLDKIGLGDSARFLGNMIATPISWAAKAISAPFRYGLKEVAAPFMQKHHYAMATDNPFWQTVKALILPKSVFANFQYERGRRSWAGSEPWVYGNTDIISKQDQLEKISSAISNTEGSLDRDRVHPFLTGGLSSSHDQMMYAKYFSSVSGGRIFDPFSPGASYSMSNSLRLAISRRHSMTEMMVTAAAISQPPQVADLRSQAQLSSIHKALSSVQYEDLDTNVLSTLKANIANNTKRIARYTSHARSWVQRQGLKVLDLIPRRFRNIDLKVKSGVKFVLSKLKAIASKGLSKITGSTFIRSSLSLVGASIDKAKEDYTSISSGVGQLLGKGKHALSNLVDFFSHPVKNIPRFVQAAGRKLKAVGRLGKSLLSKSAQFISRRVSLPDGGILSNIAVGVKRAAQGVSQFVKGIDLSLFKDKAKGWAQSFLSIGETSLFKKLSNMSEEMLSGARAGFSWAYKNIGLSGMHLQNRISNLIGGSTRKLLSKMSVGKATYVGLASLDIAMSVQSDRRLANLNSESTFREYEAAYTETSMGIAGGSIGAFLGLATKNPLLAIAGALIGGKVIGSEAGAYLSRKAYEEQNHKKGLGGYIKQSAFMSGLINLTQIPRYIKLAKAGNISGALGRAAFNTAFGFATGGFGPSTQFSLLTYGADTFDFVSKNRQGIRESFSQLKAVGRETPDYLNLLFRGKVSNQVSVAAQSSYHEMVAGMVASNNLKSPNHNALQVAWKGSRWMPDGTFTGNSVELSTSTQSILGRARLGRYTPTRMIDEARFVALHEISHSLEIRSGLEALDDTGLTRLAGKLGADANEFREVIEAMAKESTSIALHSHDGMNLDYKNATKIYADEYSAMGRTFQSMYEQFPQSAKRSYQSKVKQYHSKRLGIDEVYQRRLMDAKNFDNDFDFHIRKSPGGRPIPRSKAMTGVSKIKASANLLEDLFAVGDVAFGTYASQRVRNINSVSNLGEVSESITKARKLESSAITSTVATVLSSFVTGNAFVSMGLGLAAGITSELDLLGLTKKRVEGDLEAINQGDAITSSMEGSGYVRLHRSFVAEKALVRSTVEKPLSSLARLGKKVGSLGSLISTTAKGTASSAIKGASALANRASKGKFSQIGNRVASTINNSGISRAFASTITKASATGKKGILSLTSKVSFLYKGTASTLTNIGDSIARGVYKLSPRIGRKILEAGYKETLINSVGVALDIGNIIGGASDFLRADSNTSKAEVQSAYAQMMAGRGSLVGSLFGRFVLGGAGDAIGSIFGSLYGSTQYDELADLRYETQDYSIATVLDDLVQPLTRELRLAKAAGSLAGKGLRQGGRLVLQSAARNKAAGTALKGGARAARSISAVYKQTGRLAAKEASKRATRVIGEKAAKGISKVASKAGRLSKVGGALLKFADPVISGALFVSAHIKANKAETSAEHESAIRRSSGSSGAAVGLAIGSVLGPVGSVIGSIAGDLLGDRYGKNVSSRAERAGVSSKEVVKGQTKGGLIGGALAAVGLAALGLTTGIVTVPVALVVGGLSVLGGIVAGGESSVRKGQSEEVEHSYQKKLNPFSNRPLESSTQKEEKHKDELVRAFEKEQRAFDIREEEEGGVISSFLSSARQTLSRVFSTVRDRSTSLLRKAKTSIAGAAWSVGNLFNRQGPVGSADSGKVSNLVRTARSWEGREYKAGVFAQCAYFIRHVFNEANIDIGTRPGSSPGLAESFFHESIGQVGYTSDISQVPEGAVVGFYNTYGNYGRDVITHVGISTGGGMMVDRSTKSAPVSARSIGYLGDDSSKGANSEGNYIYVVPRDMATTEGDVSSQDTPNTNPQASRSFQPVSSKGSSQGIYTRTMENENRGSTTVAFQQPLVFPVQGSKREDFTVSQGGGFWATRNRSWGTGYHYGQDYAIASGTPLISPFDGVVTKMQAPTTSAYADITIESIDSNGKRVEVKLGHIRAAHVQVGQQVSAGQLVADSGGAIGEIGYGSGTGSHLDVKVLVDGQYVDPENLFRGASSLSVAVAGSPMGSGGGVGNIQPPKPIGVGIIATEDQKRRSGVYSTEAIIRNSAPTQADRDRLERSIELTESTIPLLNNDVTQRGVKDKASTFSDIEVEEIVAVVRSTSQAAQREVERARRRSNPQARVSVNTNNPASEARSATQNADSSRPPAINITPDIEVVVSVSASGVPSYEVGVGNGPQHKRDWETVTGLPVLHDYASMDSGLGVNQRS